MYESWGSLQYFSIDCTISLPSLRYEKDEKCCIGFLRIFFGDADWIQVGHETKHLVQQ